jgi:hypothetical protein
MHGGLHERRRYVLITPLVTEGWERAVLVQRGWVPAAWRSDAHLRAQGDPSGQARPRVCRGMCAKRWERAADSCLHLSLLCRARRMPVGVPGERVVQAGHMGP